MKTNPIKKTHLVDLLLEKIFWIYALFLYSLILPIVLISISFLGGLSTRLTTFLLAKGPYVYYGVSVAFGIFWMRGGKQKIKDWWSSKREDVKNEL